MRSGKASPVTSPAARSSVTVDWGYRPEPEAFGEGGFWLELVLGALADWQHEKLEPEGKS